MPYKDKETARIKNAEYHRKFIENRIKKGLCINCGNPNDRCSVECSECGKQRNEYSRMKYRTKKENGICPRCNNPNDRPNKTYCSKCAATHTLNTAELRKWAIDNKLCSKCHKYTVFGDEKNCPECRAKVAEYGAKYRLSHQEETRAKERRSYHKVKAEREAQGLCNKCGKELTDTTYKRCEACRIKINQRNIEYRNKTRPDKSKVDIWKENNLCLLCGAERKEGFIWCEYHYQKSWEHLHNNTKIIKNRKEMKRYGK